MLKSHSLYSTVSNVTRKFLSNTYKRTGTVVANGGDAANGLQPGNGYVYHTFTSPGNLEVFMGDTTAEILVVAGGGGGGQTIGGGGGAGGIVYHSAYPLPIGIHSVTVGGGGAGAVGNPSSPVHNVGSGTSGSDTIFSNIVAKGGGGGGNYGATANNAQPGGSGGGTGAGTNGTTTGTQPSQPQPGVPSGYIQYGNAGGESPSTNQGGAGGGAGGAASGPTAGVGTEFTGFAGYLIGVSTVGSYYAGGGGAGGRNPGGVFSAGGSGVGGDGGNGDVGSNGLSNSGGGGGGGGYRNTPAASFSGGNGGAGIVVVRYPVSLTTPSTLGIVTSGLVLHLDAGDSASYPGTGTTWTDLSGNGYNFTINASAYSTSGGIAHMNFEGSYGAAKRIVSGSLSDVPNYSNATMMCFSTILNSTSTWRTLTRGAANDHQVIIQELTNNLGMYDQPTGFHDSGFDIPTLPNPYTQFNCLVWRLSQSSPYYEFQYNTNSSKYSITNANATHDNGFSVIGAFHNGSTGTGAADSSQYWGKISVFLYYNRSLTQAEISQNFNALRGRFGL